MKYVLAELSDLPAIRQLMAKYHRDTIAPEDMADGFVIPANTTAPGGGRRCGSAATWCWRLPPLWTPTARGGIPGIIC